MKSKCLLLAAVLVLGGCTKSPEATVQSFYKAVESGDHEAAIKLLHPSAMMLGESKLRAAMELQAAHLRGCGGISDIDVKLAPGSEAQKQGTVTLSFKGSCKAVTEPVGLAKLNDRWRLEP
jgi:hypothetical protein